MLSILNLTKTTKLILAAFAFLAVLAFCSGRAHAATLNVAGGCTLNIAIDSVNAGANQSGCTATGSAYGTDDTINLPSGTQTLNADLPGITEPVIISGAAMDQTTIDGNNGQYEGIYTNSEIALTIKDLSINGFKQFAIYADTPQSLTIDHVEVDGVDALPSSGAFQGIFVISNSSNGMTVDISDVYIHNLESNTSLLSGLVVAQNEGGVTTNLLKNITVADITNTRSDGGGAIGVMLTVGVFGNDFGSAGTLNTTASNITIDGIHHTSANAAAFSNNAFSSGGDAIVNTTINNVTVVNTDGQLDGDTGVNSAAFYAVGIGVGAGTTATSTINVGNSLMAHNTSASNSSNCVTGNLTSLVGGNGTAVSTVSSQGHNIFDDNSCAGIFTSPTDQHNVSNVYSTLGPLQNNGGNVPTRALLPGSPAISAGGSVLGVTTDARGVTRPGDCPSVGAYQFEGAVCGAATSPDDEEDPAAPDTGVNPASLLGITTTSLAGVLSLGYAFSRKRE